MLAKHWLRRLVKLAFGCTFAKQPWAFAGFYVQGGALKLTSLQRNLPHNLDQTVQNIYTKPYC